MDNGTEGQQPRHASDDMAAARQLPEHRKWLRRANIVYRDSTSFYESSVFKEWRDALAHFHNRHASDSKYNSAAYAGRSKTFRPKPRATVRTLEATAAAALFTNDDLVSLSGVDPNNRDQEAAARALQALLQYRLENTIPWFLTVIGAYQTTHIHGCVVSKQYWDYRMIRDVTYEPQFDEFTGEPLMDDDGVLLGKEVITAEEVVADRPWIDLIAPENFRYDPGSDWRDPVGTSPYLVELIPMYAIDVMAMQDDGWFEYSLAEIIAHGTQDLTGVDSVRSAREGRREDSREVDATNEYSTVWVHFYILMDESGRDWCFYTVGTTLMLTEPMPLKEYDILGRDRYRVGTSMVEANRSMPSGTITVTKGLTELSNDITNQRMDNVKLALNRRYAYRREANIDFAAMMRNVPGGGVMMDDPERDFKVIETPDVTQSSYVEQDRVNIEADELTGTFSQASVGSNRFLGETVGGMNIMNMSANQVQELGLKCFVETWVEPVLRTLVKLEALYETDEKLLAVAASKAEIVQQIDDNLMSQDLVVRVNVGMGNTNPDQKLERFMRPLQAAMNLPEFAQRLDMEEIGREIFALSGQGSGDRFLLTDEQMAEKAQQQPPVDPRVQVERLRSEAKMVDQEMSRMELELKSINQDMEHQRFLMKLAQERDMKMEDIYSKYGIEREKMATMERLQQLREQNRRDMAALKDRREALTQRLQASNLAMSYDTF